MFPLWTEEQLALRKEVIDFAREKLAPTLRERERKGEFQREAWAMCGAEGILGSHVPQEFGGRGRDALTTVMMLEALGYGCRDNGLTLALGGQMWSVQEPLLTFGSEEQKRTYLPRLCSGEWIGVHAVSEETSGSDALSLQTTAKKTEGGYILNGRKCFVGMAPEADLALVLANSKPNAGRWGVSAFIVQRGMAGFSVSDPRPKMGTRTNPIGDLIFEECFVPEQARLGPEGIGVSWFSRAMNWERGFTNAGHLGAMEATMEKCVEHARTRRQFDRPIGDFQAVSHRIANMKLRLETSRLMLYRVASMKDHGMVAELECAMAKLHITESLVESAMDAVRIHGARGYLEEFEIERELRDAVGSVIYGGTSDIQRNLIARMMGLGIQ